MNWIFYDILAIFCDAPRVFLDNYVSDVYFKDRYAASQKLFYGYTYAILGIVVAIIFAQDFANFTWIGILSLVASGALSSIANVPYYMALEIDDSTNLGIFLQIAPILYLLINFFVFGETIGIQQLIAFCIILAGPALIILTAKKRSRHLRVKAVFFIFLYVLISVIGNIIFVESHADGTSFVLPLALFFLGKGIMNLLIVYPNRKWLRHYRRIVKKDKRVFRPLTLNFAFGIATDATYRVALALAPSTAIASAIADSSTPIVIFFMGIIFTLIWPKFGREKLTRKSVIVHLIATALVAIGVMLVRNA
ncbi:EamA family transporter [Candidatus Saccharibacteria bacterium]|nr:EamA family transporter [Candidatus Saccharibacteria bacterium]